MVVIVHAGTRSAKRSEISASTRPPLCSPSSTHSTPSKIGVLDVVVMSQLHGEVPGARVIPRHAGQRRIWPPATAAASSLGLSDEIATLDLVREKSHDSALAREFLSRVSLVQEAIKAKELRSPLRPLEVLDWARLIDLKFNARVAAAVRRFHKPDDVGPNGDRGRPVEGGAVLRRYKSALVMIEGMSTGGYGFDPSARRNSATQKIKSAIELRGKTLDEETILGLCREACVADPTEPVQDRLPTSTVR